MKQKNILNEHFKKTDQEIFYSVFIEKRSTFQKYLRFKHTYETIKKGLLQLLFLKQASMKVIIYQ